MPKRKSPYLLRDMMIPTSRIGLFLSEEDYLKECRRLGVDYPHPFAVEGCVNTFTLKNGIKVHMVCVNLKSMKGVENGQVYGVLIHEAVHIFQIYCQDIGEDKPSLEFQAYTIQGIAQRLIYMYANLTQE